MLHIAARLVTLEMLIRLTRAREMSDAMFERVERFGGQENSAPAYWN